MFINIYNNIQIIESNLNKDINNKVLLLNNFLTIKQMSNSKTEQLYGPRVNSTAQTTGITKYATLSPYLAEIEKRKKARSVLRENRNKNKHENSSKSFRIKERSTSSLQSQSKRQLKNQTIINILSKANSRKKQQSNRSKQLIVASKQITQNPASTYTIKSSASRTFSRNDAIEVREKQKQHRKKDISFRRNKFQSKSRTDDNSQFNDKLKQTIQVTKYGYTDTNRTIRQKQKSREKEQTTVNVKKTENMYAVAKNKFRRGKYQALYSSVNSSQVIAAEQNVHQPTKSQSRLEISKKQSTLSINKDVDLMAEKQMQNYYRHMRSKQIRKSLQKSTQKYFKQDSTYRAPKTNNDIEIYISTMKNPSVNRKSNASTVTTSQKQEDHSHISPRVRTKQNNYLNYDFQFKDTEQANFSGITEIDNPSQQESINNFQEQGSFQKQRKQVEKQYFHKKSPQIDWSQDDCQIDQL